MLTYGGGAQISVTITIAVKSEKAMLILSDFSTTYLGENTAGNFLCKLL